MRVKLFTTSNENIRMRSVLLRSSGMVGQAEVHVEVDGNKPLTDVELLLLEIEMEVLSKIPSIERALIIPHSSSLSKPGTRKMEERWRNIERAAAIVEFSSLF